MMSRYSDPKETRADTYGLSQPALESAVGAPQAGFGGQWLYPSLAAMAGALWHSLTCNHAFIDGNKRVGLAACSTFLRLNGQMLTLTEDEAESTSLRMASGELRREQVIE